MLRASTVAARPLQQFLRHLQQHGTYGKAVMDKRRAKKSRTNSLECRLHLPDAACTLEAIRSPLK